MTLPVFFVGAGLGYAHEDISMIRKCDEIKIELGILKRKHNFLGLEFHKTYREIINEKIEEYKKCGCDSVTINYNDSLGIIKGLELK